MSMSSGGKDEADDDDTFQMKISSLRNTLAEAESDITRATACKLREHIVKMRESFATEKKRLNSEIQRLKKRAKEAEEKRWNGNNGQCETIGQLKMRLREFASGDRTMEMIFKDIVGRIAVTVPNLSEELVNVSEDLYKSNCQNGQLRYEIDELKAMLRINSGDPESFLKRIAEFKDIAHGLAKNISRLKNNLEENAWNENWDYWKYLEIVKRIQETVLELERKVKSDREALLCAGNPTCLRYIRKIVSVRLILRELHAELDNSLIQANNRKTDGDSSESKQCIEKVSFLKKIIQRTSADLGRLKIEPVNGFKIGVTSCVDYTKKVRVVEESLDRCKRKINELDLEPKESEYSRMSRSKTLGELRELVDELCSRLKDLENMVYTGEDSKLSGRIEELEELLVKTKLELSTKEEAVASLEERLELGRKTLEENHEKNAALARKIDAFEEDSKSRLAEMRRVRAELDSLKVQLQDLTNDKENLFAETEKMRKQLAEKNDEMSKKLATRDASLRKLHDALDKASKEKEELTKKLMQSERESPRLRTERELNQAKANLTEASNAICDLRKKLERAITESQRFQQEAMRLNTENEKLKERANDAEDSREDYRSILATLENKIEDYDRENIHQRDEIVELCNERELLKSRVAELEKKKVSLMEQVEKWKVTRAALEEEADDWKIRSNELASEVERANGELSQVRTENATLNADLGALTLKNNETEARLRSVSTEKDELATRTKKLDEENVSLKDRLNKVLAEQEYLTVELNKSRIECDKAKSRNVELGQTVEELNAKCNETKARYEKLDDQARSLRVANEILRSENEMLKARSNEFLERVRILTEGNEDGDLLLIDQDKRKSKKDTSKTRDKVKPKEKLISDAKMLRLANESLKLELANLKTENAEYKTELLRLKNEPVGYPSEAVEITELRSIFLRSQRGDDENKASSSRAEQKFGSFPNEATLEPRPRGEFKKKFETLNSAISKLRGANGALKTEIDILRESMHAAITDKERASEELRRTLDELKALKIELTKLRNEKGTLRSRLDNFRVELDSMKNEKAALKDELSLLRQTNADLRTRIGVLQDSYEKLQIFNARLENKLEGTLKCVNKYTVSSEHPNEFEKELNGILMEYASMKESFDISNNQPNKKQFIQGESTNVSDTFWNTRDMEV